MRIQRTVKESYLGIPFKYAGETEVIEQERMERIIGGTLAVARQGQPLFTVDDGLAQLTRTGKLETFYATYELLES